VLSVLHGVVDGGRLWVCLRDAATGAALHGGLPEPSAGLGFGSAAQVAVDWDVASANVDAELFTATAEDVEGRSCDDLRANAAASFPIPRPTLGDAGPDAGELPPASFPETPPVPRSAGAVGITAGALGAGQHYLLVAAGCATPGAPQDPALCGVPDPFGGPARSLLLVEVPQQTIDDSAAFGLQFLNASRATARSGVVLQGQDGHQTALDFVDEVDFGAIRPRTVATVAVPDSLELHLASSERAEYAQTWTQTLTSSGVDAFAFGTSYLLVYVGPAPAAIGTQELSDPRFVLVSGG
jgi:hypothetical protein